MAGAILIRPLLEEHTAFLGWLQRGCHGTMAWLESNSAALRDPRLAFPAAKSIIVTGLPYGDRDLSALVPRVSLYAQSTDYHFVARQKLEQLFRAIQILRPDVCGWLAADSSPLLEKALGARAGLGWPGKHTCLINPLYGSFFFLAELLLDAEVEESAPLPNQCTGCGRCVKACPSGALQEPGFLDARRCIACWTVEYRDILPRPDTECLEGRLLGCDACQLACPFNQGRLRHSIPELAARPEFAAPGPDILCQLSRKAFDRAFRTAAFRRPGQALLLRTLVALSAHFPGLISDAGRNRALGRYPLAERQWRVMVSG